MQNKPQNLYVAERKWLRALLAVILLAAAVFIAWLCIYMMLLPTDELTNNGEMSIAEAYAICIAALILLTPIFFIPGTLYFNKLRYPYTFWADEEGVHDYYHVLRTGTIYWQEIGEITLHKFNPLDPVPDSCILLKLKDAKAFKTSHSFFWKIMRGSAVALPFHLSYGNRRDIYAALAAMYEYYKNNRGKENG